MSLRPNPKIAPLAEIILDTEGLDVVDAVRTLQPLLAPELFNDLCESLALCCVHVVDAEICADVWVEECEGGTKRP